jgi:hypothetical protein
MRPPIIAIVAPRLLASMSLVIEIGNITLWPFIISRDPMGPIELNHESVHAAQQLEFAAVITGLFGALALVLGPWWALGILWAWLPFLGPYYAVYALQWAWTWVRIGPVSEELIANYEGIGDRGAAAYHLMPLEQEAYDNEFDLKYLGKRRPFGWLRYRVATDGTIPWAGKRP